MSSGFSRSARMRSSLDEMSWFSPRPCARVVDWNASQPFCGCGSKAECWETEATRASHVASSSDAMHFSSCIIDLLVAKGMNAPENKANVNGLIEQAVNRHFGTPNPLARVSKQVRYRAVCDVHGPRHEQPQRSGLTCLGRRATEPVINTRRPLRCCELQR
jgi:hypothetical protein